MYDTPHYGHPQPAGTIDFLSRQSRWSAETHRLRGAAAFPKDRVQALFGRSRVTRPAAPRGEEPPVRRRGAPKGRKGHSAGMFLFLLAALGAAVLVFGTDRFPKAKAKGLELAAALRAIEAKAHSAVAADTGAAVIDGAEQHRSEMRLGTELPDSDIANAEMSVSLGRADDSQRRRLAEERLRQLGAERGKLTGWGSDLWRYSCSVAGYHYEAIAASEAEALEQAAEKISRARR